MFPRVLEIMAVGPSAHLGLRPMSSRFLRTHSYCAKCAEVARSPGPLKFRDKDGVEILEDIVPSVIAIQSGCISCHPPPSFGVAS